MQDPELWARIKDHALPLANGKGLERAVLRHGRLGSKASRTVLQEYRRFLYLAAVAGAEVTAPPLLREVWRAHAKDHQGYTIDLVRGAIRRPMPEPFDAPLPLSDPAHRRTRALYWQEFGQRPMPALWPGPAAMLVGRALGLAVPGFGVLAVWLVLATWLPWAFVAGAAALALALVRARVAPWEFAKRDTAVDLDFGGSGQGGGDFDLLTGGD